MKYLCLLFTTCLLSCVSYPRSVEEVSIDYGQKLPLIKDNTWASFSALQELTIKRDGKEFSFKVQLEVADNTIIVIGLTPVHSRSFMITYKDGIIDYEEHPFFKYPLSPEQMIADIQMAWVPLKLWQKTLKGTEVTVENIKGTDNTVFKCDDKKLVDISRNGKEVLIVHHGFEFSIRIKTLDIEQL